MAANLVSFLTGKKKKHKEGNLGRQVFGLASCTVWTLVFTLVTVRGTVHAPRYCSQVGKALLTACYCSEGLWSSFLSRVFYYSRATAWEIVEGVNGLFSSTGYIQDLRGLHDEDI
jgi:hypothetical protein